MEAANRLTNSDVKAYLKNVDKFCEKFSVTDSQLNYYAPVHDAMRKDPAYAADEKSTSEEKIGTSVAFNFIHLPIDFTGQTLKKY